MKLLLLLFFLVSASFAETQIVVDRVNIGQMRTVNIAGIPPSLGDHIRVLIISNAQIHEVTVSYVDKGGDVVLRRIARGSNAFVIVPVESIADIGVIHVKAEALVSESVVEVTR